MWGGGNILEIIAKDKHILIRKMEANEADFHMYLKWMTDPETMKYWEGMTEHFTYSRVIENYWENVREARDVSNVNEPLFATNTTI